MSVQYLVDYENVHDLGLFGMNTISAEDSVYILHTSGADRITLSLMDNMAGWVKVILVPPGKQSLDMHLGTFLGYLIGQEQDAETRYVIISNDTDYYGIAAFWNSTYGKTDKVRCFGSITVAVEAGDVDTILSEPREYTVDGIAMREYIVNLMDTRGITSRMGLRGILVSELCSRLNDCEAYRKERARTGKKPMQFLLTECRDLIWISRKRGQDWAYLLPGDHTYHIDECAEDSEADGDAVEQGSPEEPLGNNGNGYHTEAESADANCRDLHPESGKDPEPVKMPETAAMMEQGALQSADPEKEKIELENIALEYLARADKSVRNGKGHIRASALRDELLKDIRFKIALGKSKMQPIPYIGQMFADKINLYREKGFYWIKPVSEGTEEECGSGTTTPPESPLHSESTDKTSSESDTAENTTATQRKKSFYEKAFQNIYLMFVESDFEKSVAEGITECYMQADAAENSRDAFHTLLKQRFGDKMGIRYYRFAVRQLGLF